VGAVHALFLDPTARHALIVLREGSGAGARGGETLYAHASQRKARPVARLRGCAPTAVAWHAGPAGATDAATREVLVGTSQGMLCELYLEANDKKERFKPLLELRDREPVCGLHMEVRTRSSALCLAFVYAYSLWLRTDNFALLISRFRAGRRAAGLCASRCWR